MGVERPVQGTGTPEGVPHAALFNPALSGSILSLIPLECYNNA